MKRLTNSSAPILLLGAYGRGNAGDDVFVYAAKELFSGHEIYINSTDNELLPPKVRDSFKTISTVSATDVLQKLRIFLRIRTVVYWGGDLWVELYGTRVPRQLLYKMLLMNMLLRLTGKRIYYVGCGIGKLTGYSLWLARLSARMAHSIVLREEYSRKLLAIPRAIVLPDIAVNLPLLSPRLHHLSQKRPMHIVVSLLWSIPNPNENFERLLSMVAGLLNSLEGLSYVVTLLPMQISEAEKNDDLWTSEQLLKRLKGSNAKIYHERELEKILGLLQGADLVIGARLHTNILAVLNGTPAIGIAYRQKVRSFFEDNGLGAYCVDLEQLAELEAVFAAMVRAYDEAARKFHLAAVQCLERRRDYAKLADSL
jgi:polysaccharide pyruvyl transferase WcaK-like protein